MQLHAQEPLFLNFANYKYFSRCLLQIFHIFFVACKLPTIFLGIIPWKIVGKYVENLKQAQRATTCNGKL